MWTELEISFSKKELVVVVVVDSFLKRNACGFNFLGVQQLSRVI